MGLLLSYSISVAIVLIPLYAVYRTVLSHTTLLAFNRMTLLSIYLVSLLLPIAATLAGHAADSPAGGGIVPGPVAIAGADGIGAAGAGSGSGWYRAAVWVYTIGAAILSCRLIASLCGILWLAAAGERCRIGGHTVVRHGRVGLVPFSWCRWIFIPADGKPADTIVLAHEASHLARRHWIDLLVAEAVLIIDWYNPAAWQMRDSLQDIHEFQADGDVLAGGVDPRTYQLFLIKKTVGDRFHALADSLNHSSLKKRITMMLSTKSRSSARLRAMALVPALALGAMVVDLPAVASVVERLGRTDLTAAAAPAAVRPTEAAAHATEAPASDSKDTNKSVSDTHSGQVYTAVEQMPQFPGGERALYQFVMDHIRYPEVNPLPEKPVTVVVRFEISATGKVENPTVIRSARYDAFDREAIRVVRSLPAFEPGRIDGKPVSTHFTLPISFSSRKSSQNTTSGTAPTVIEHKSDEQSAGPDGITVIRYS